MNTRVAKAIARAIPRTIIWSLVLAVVAAGPVWVIFAAVGYWNWGDAAGAAGYAGSVAFLAGLVVFPLYLYVKIEIKRAHYIVNTALAIIAWSLVLAVIGGIAGYLIGAPVALASGLITFTAYEVSKRVRFVRKKQDESHRLGTIYES